MTVVKVKWKGQKQLKRCSKLDLLGREAQGGRRIYRAAILKLKLMTVNRAWLWWSHRKWTTPYIEMLRDSLCTWTVYRWVIIELNQEAGEDLNLWFLIDKCIDVCTCWYLVYLRQYQRHFWYWSKYRNMLNIIKFNVDRFGWFRSLAANRLLAKRLWWNNDPLFIQTVSKLLPKRCV